MRRSQLPALAAALLAVGPATLRADDPPTLRAGAFAQRISPTRLPVIVNGGFEEARGEILREPLHARCLVLDDGTTRLAIAVVDSCMLPRELIDRVKALAAESSGIRPDRILISANHTHSAPSAMGALGSRADADYAAELPARIAQGIARAAANLEPAEVGWAAVDAPELTHCRRWVRRPDRMLDDPFGARTVRANMHPGHQNPDAIAPSGPVDPGLSVVAFRSPDGRPIAVLANFSMHYYGDGAVSADYYGRFASALTRRLDAEKLDRPFVAMMTQGTSGDSMWMDYGAPAPTRDIDAYADAVAAKAEQAVRSVEYRTTATLAMAEARLTLGRRLPDAERLAWARPIVEKIGDRLPKGAAEVYALEALALDAEPRRELVLQAIRIGDAGIAAIPNEVYGITGLKLKARNPLPFSFNVALANGSEGYIPTPEAHELGGYCTWPARTAGLEVAAEPKIVDALLGLAQAVAGRPPRPDPDPRGSYAADVLADEPRAYWRMHDLEGKSFADATGRGARLDGRGGLCLAVDGPGAWAFSEASEPNRAVHLAGGNLKLGDNLRSFLAGDHTIELWFWNGLPNDARGLTAELIRWGEADGDRLVVGGTNGDAGRLGLWSTRNGGRTAVGAMLVEPKRWYHLVAARSGERLVVRIDGVADLEGTIVGGSPTWIGGASEGAESLEGKVDEIALFDRALTEADVAARLEVVGPRP